MKQNFVIVRKTPLSALRAAQSEFSSPRHVFRAHHYQIAAASPFLHEPQVCGKLSALTERRGFRTRRNCLHSSHNFFRADERKSREAGGNLLFTALRRLCNGFTPRLAAFYQWCAPKCRAKRENRTQSVAKHKRTSGCLLNHGKFFCQLKRIFCEFIRGENCVN